MCVCMELQQRRRVTATPPHSEPKTAMTHARALANSFASSRAAMSASHPDVLAGLGQLRNLACPLAAAHKVQRHLLVHRSGGDGKWMPVKNAELGDANENPLACGVHALAIGNGELHDWCTASIVGRDQPQPGTLDGREACTNVPRCCEHRMSRQ